MRNFVKKTVKSFTTINMCKLNLIKNLANRIDVIANITYHFGVRAFKHQNEGNEWNGKS